MARVLVVDDEEGIREFLVEVLSSAGHELVACADGASALEELSRRDFALLISDLKMPHVDGLTLLARARELDPSLEVLVLTAHGSIDTAVRAIKLGAFDFLQKPLGSPEELRLIAARALEHRALLTAQERVTRAEPPELELGFGDPSMARVIEALRKVAPTDATVLILGESGTGKELAARAVHRWSRRRVGPFVAVNCAALSENLLESELFGHEKGAFTGAIAPRRGRIELAAGGSFFLDEVGELKLELQAKLLRLLQERSFERIGGTRTLSADARFIAATNRDLLARVREGAFREDLYHRLAVFPVELPPLRERRADLLPLARVLLERAALAVGRRGLVLSEAAERVIAAGEWRGNVRELENALERAAIVCTGSRIEPADLAMIGSRAVAAPAMSAAVEAPETLDALERAAIERALGAVDGNRRKAAERLGIGVRTLYEKLKRYGIG